MANDYYANATGPQSCSSSRWLTEEVYKLIDMVQHDEAIYNPRHKYYFCRPYVETFWREVDQKLEKNPGASLAKWTNLRISFRREYTNYLEEKVPPCWTYFDRMFFLHPYLRKKHSQPKSLDSQVQDALVRISSLSNRFHRERTATAVSTAGALSSSAATGANMQAGNLNNQTTQQQHLDNYLEYFDDPEQNNSDDLDDVADDRQQRRLPPSFRHAGAHHQQEQDDHDHHILNNDIKSECDDVKSDIDEYESESAVRQDEVDSELLEEMEMRNFMMDSYAYSNSATSTQNSLEDKRAQHVRMQHLMRLQQQTRAYQGDPQMRIKRPRSQEGISSTHMNSSGVAGGGTHTTNVSQSSSSSLPSTAAASSSTTGTMSGGYTRMPYSTTSTPSIHANVSLVRPTVAKPVDVVSTTTSNNGSVGLSVGAPLSLNGNALANNHSNANTDSNATSTSNANNQLPPTSTLLSQHQRHSSTNHSYTTHHHHNQSGSGGGSGNHHRLEFAALTSGAAPASNNGIPVSGTSTVSAGMLNSPPISGSTVAPTHMELCDCKTDPDAMFLMSLLPDIQKLNGRDRGKIKIAFQNILQDYLYPD